MSIAGSRRRLLRKFDRFYGAPLIRVFLDSKTREHEVRRTALISIFHMSPSDACQTHLFSCGRNRESRAALAIMRELEIVFMRAHSKRRGNGVAARERQRFRNQRCLMIWICSDFGTTMIRTIVFSMIKMTKATALTKRALQTLCRKTAIRSAKTHTRLVRTLSIRVNEKRARNLPRYFCAGKNERKIVERFARIDRSALSSKKAEAPAEWAERSAKLEENVCRIKDVFFKFAEQACGMTVNDRIAARTGEETYAKTEGNFS